MGQKLTPSNKKLITPEVEVFLLKYFPSFQFQKLLSNIYPLLFLNYFFNNRQRTSDQNSTSHF